MNTGWIDHKIIFLYAAPYLSGAFYDSFEYFMHYFNKGYDCGLYVIIRDVSNEKIMETLKERYIFPSSSIPMYIGDSSKKIHKVKCETIVVTSIYSMASLMNGTILMPFSRALTMQETTNVDYVNWTFRKYPYKEKITVLSDYRVFAPLSMYKNINYKRKLNFDIFKPIQGEVDDCCIINVATKHKAWSCEDILKTIWNLDSVYPKYLIYTQNNNYDDYKALHDPSGKKFHRFISVEIAPVENYLNRFTGFLYFGSLRKQDPSPRIFAECEYYGKKMHIWDMKKFKEIRDGSYYRWLDVNNDWDSIDLKNDELYKYF